MKQRLTLEEIRIRIRNRPDGPIVLWHFKGIKDAAHAQNHNQLTENCHVEEDCLVIDGQTWQVTDRVVGENGGGFAMLVKVPARKLKRRDPKQWWAEQNLRRQLAEKKGGV